MDTNFEKSYTKENLMRAFAGESQARNRYTFAAQKAKENNLHVIDAIFTFTAHQERAHAKVFYDFLKEQAGSNINVDGNYPVDIYDNVSELLRSAQHNEFEEYENDYKKFAAIAKEEGFIGIYNIFDMIANVEKTHGERFGHFADLLEQGKLFVSDIETSWVCLNCGHIYTGKEVPAICPICKHDRGFFVRVELSPFGK